MNLKRIKYLQDILISKNIDLLFIVSYENRRYYSGFSGSNGWLVITPQEQYIITDGRYFSQVLSESPLYTLVKVDVKKDGKDISKTFARLIKEKKMGNKIGFEAKHITVDLFNKLKSLLGSEFSFEDVSDDVTTHRLVKDEEELKEIKKAIYIAEEGFHKLLKDIQEGITERELAAKLGFYMKILGAKKEAFDIIVASGKNGAMPHANVSDRKLKKGEAVVFDWGALVDSGYHSDMTRTLFIGKMEGEMKKIYFTVKEAQEKVISQIHAGMSCNDADKIARNTIEEAGYGDYFVHGLGHGVGLAIHEGPTLKEGSDTILKEGMVVTIEPGIYIPQLGGVRIEDMVLITSNGCEVLTSIEKDIVL